MRGMDRPLVLLPGLDGSATLFEPFVAAAPAGTQTVRVPLPADRARGYGELAAWVSERLPPEPVVVIAESFSGPLALMVADRCRNVCAVVLAASFVEPPLPRWLARAPRFLWGRSPPVALLGFLMTAGDRSLAVAVQRAVAMLDAEVVAARIAAALRVDVAA